MLQKNTVWLADQLPHSSVPRSEYLGDSASGRSGRRVSLPITLGMAALPQSPLPGHHCYYLSLFSGTRVCLLPSFLLFFIWAKKEAKHISASWVGGVIAFILEWKGAFLPCAAPAFQLAGLESSQERWWPQSHHHPTQTGEVGAATANPNLSRGLRVQWGLLPPPPLQAESVLCGP